MNLMPKKFIPFIACIFLILSAKTAVGKADGYLNDENCRLLVQLDTLLSRLPDIDRRKEADIARLRSRFFHTRDLERRYWLAVNLYDEYAAYDSDSAMVYVDRAYELATTLGRRDWQTDAELNRAYLLSATGLLDDADKCLRALDEKSMTDTQLHKYCDRNIFLFSHKDQYIGDIGRQTAYPERVDSLINDAMKNMAPDDPYYGWIVGWGHFKDESEALKAINIIKPLVDRSEFKTREDALNAWVLSKLYEYAADNTQKMKYLILSAMADIRGSVKEVASLEEVAALLINEGDFERANTYINYSFLWANHYKSRIRLGQLARLKEETINALYQHSRNQAEQNSTMMWLLVAVLGVLLLALLYIIRQYRQLARSRRALKRANVSLEKRVEELSATRGELDESNRRLAAMYDKARRSASQLSDINEAKEKYIANIFTICSDYITKLDDFRKAIFRMIVARRFDELKEMCKSPELSHSEIKQLYANFDRIFLQIYPDFVADFNTLLRPEEQIHPRGNDTLTTELRIYALVRLGLNDSVKIARFLHISVQTVYNTRQRTRNKAAVPREEFAAAVQSLGKSSF